MAVRGKTPSCFRTTRGTSSPTSSAGTGPNFQFDSPQTEIDAHLAYVGIDSVTSLWNVTPPGQNGAPGNLEYEEFTATFEGNPVHGLIYSDVSLGAGSTRVSSGSRSRRRARGTRSTARSSR